MGVEAGRCGARAVLGLPVAGERHEEHLRANGGAHATRDLEAVDERQADVDEGDVRPDGEGPRDALDAVDGDVDLVAEALEQLLKRLAIVCAILDDEDATPRDLPVGAGREVLGLGRERLREGEAHREGRAAPEARARRRDGAAVEPHERAHDAEPEAHPALGAIERALRLSEGLEDAAEGVRVDAHARVGDAQDGLAVIGARLDADRDPPARGRVLERVREQVVDDLLEAHAIAEHEDGSARGFEEELEAAFVARAAALLYEAEAHRAEVGVVDLPVDDRDGPLEAPHGDLVALEHLRGVAHGAERVAQLVSQHRQELIALPHLAVALLERVARRVLPCARAQRRAQGADHRQHVQGPFERRDVAEAAEPLEGLLVLARRRGPLREDQEGEVGPRRLRAQDVDELGDDLRRQGVLGDERCARARRHVGRERLTVLADEDLNARLLERARRERRVSAGGRQDEDGVFAVLLLSGHAFPSRRPPGPPSARP